MIASYQPYQLKFKKFEEQIDYQLKNYVGEKIKVQYYGYSEQIINAIMKYYTENGWQVNKEIQTQYDQRDGSYNVDVLAFS